MKLKQLLTVCVSALTLASCFGGGSNSFYGKTFTYKDDVCYNMTSDNTAFNKSLESVIKEQMAANNINWDKSGYANSILLWETVEPFEKHESYDGIINEINTNAKATMKTVLSDLSVTFDKYTKGAENKVSVTYKGETKSYTVKPYGEDTEDASYLYFYQGDTSVGHMSVATFNNNGWSNGVLNCAELEYAGFTSCVKVKFTFNNPVSDKTELSWRVYAKIAN